MNDPILEDAQRLANERMAENSQQDTVLDRFKSAAGKPVDTLLDSVFGKVGVDVNDLRAYDELNWDAVNGIDDVSKRIANVQGSIAKSLETRINKAWETTDNVDGTLQSSIVGRILTPQQTVEELHSALANDLVNRVGAIAPGYLGNGSSFGNYVVYRPKADVGYVPGIETLSGYPTGFEAYGPFGTITREQQQIVASLPTRPLSAVIQNPQPQVAAILGDALDKPEAATPIQTTFNPVSGVNDIGPLPVDSVVPGDAYLFPPSSNPVAPPPSVHVTPPDGYTPGLDNPGLDNPGDIKPDPIVINDPVTGCTIRLIMPEIKVAPCQPNAPNVDYTLISNLVTNIVTTVMNNITNNNQVSNTTNVVNQATTNNVTSNDNRVDNSQNDRRVVTNNITNEGSTVTNAITDLSSVVYDNSVTNNYAAGNAGNATPVPNPDNHTCLANKGDFYFGLTQCGEATWDEFNERHAIRTVSFPNGQKLGDIVELIRKSYTQELGE
jgi:hypothetical protein